LGKKDPAAGAMADLPSPPDHYNGKVEAEELSDEEDVTEMQARLQALRS